MLKAPTASASKFEARRGAAAAASAATAVKVVYNFFFSLSNQKLKVPCGKREELEKTIATVAATSFYSKENDETNLQPQVLRLNDIRPKKQESLKINKKSLISMFTSKMR